MAVVAVCPNCGESNVFRTGRVGACSHCDQLLPDEVRVAVLQALARERPLLIKIRWGFSVFVAGLVALMLLMTLLGVGTYSINDVPVSRREFVKAAGPFLLGLGFVVGALAWGFWKQKSWTRELALLFWPFAVAPASALDYASGTPLTEVISGGVIGGLIPLAIAIWYFYVKQNVVAYYRALASDVAG